MFGVFKSYDNEYIELYDYLTREWKMNQRYAQNFLTAYKKSIGKILSDGKRRMEMLEKSADPEHRMMRMANLGEEYPYALVGQAYNAYMTDLRHGKYHETEIEKAIWAILINRSDLVETLDRGFAGWLERNHEEKFPDLFEEVFD